MKNKIPIRYDSYHAIGDKIVLYLNNVPVHTLFLEDAIQPFLAALEEMETIDYIGDENES